jgi:uncharacterized membrane protein YccC
MSRSMPKTEPTTYVSVESLQTSPAPHVIMEKWFKPLSSNLSFRSETFRFAITFAITGAIGLLIAVDLGLQKQYWVLITVCIVLLRSSISKTIFSYTTMRIIGTIVGAAMASVITLYVGMPGILL